MPGIFDGVRVLELGAGAAGPVATRYFADHGATVVKVESATRPDFMRLVHYRKDDPHGLEAQPLYVLMNPNKKNVSINLSHPEGVELVLRLVDWADVVAENFSPRAMAKWGLDHASLRARKPGLDPERHTRKVAAVDALPEAPGVVRVDAAQPLDAVLLELKQRIWDAL